MRARYYSPYLCRFLNADPIGFSGGSNWFAYADGNPISLNDPFGLSPAWQLPPQLSQDAAFAKGYVDARANPVLAGFVAGATGAVVVTVGAPFVASGLVAAGMSTAAATATVTGGLGVAAVVGGTATALDTYEAVNTDDWDRVAFNASSLAGGALVGGLGGGRYIADSVGISPSTVPKSLNPFADRAWHYQSGKGSLVDWLATAPTPQSGGGAAAITATGATSALSNIFGNQSGTNEMNSRNGKNNFNGRK